MHTIEEIKQLKQKRKEAMFKAIQINKRFKIIKKVYFLTKSDYENKIAQYNKLDREYAFALFDKEQKKLKKFKQTKPYNANKRTAAKALKALESLPEEMRKQIIKNAQEGLF